VLLGLPSYASGNNCGSVLWSDGFIDGPMLAINQPVAMCAICRKPFWAQRANCLGEIPPFWVQGRIDIDWASLALVEVGSNRILVMKVLREHLGWSLPDTIERVVGSLPVALMTADPLVGRVQELRDALTSVGATTRYEEQPATVVEHPSSWDAAPWAADLDEGSAFDMLDLARFASRHEELWLRVRAWHLGNMPYRKEGSSWLPIASRGPRLTRNLEHLLHLTDDPGLDRVTRAEVARELGRFELAKHLLDEQIPDAKSALAETLRVLANNREERVVVVATAG